MCIRDRTFNMFLRLGYIFLRRKSWPDAKAVFLRACELFRQSSYAWLGIGISCTRMGDYKEAEEALTEANIFDPLNADTWGYLALMCLHDNGRVIQANQALREMFNAGVEQIELLEEIADELARLGKSEMAETCYRKLIEMFNGGRVRNSLTERGSVHLKLAKILHAEGRLAEATEEYQEAHRFAVSESERDKIKTILETLSSA
eukprot:TRINITY_DN1715_c0_g6_i4.p1 TRINITY_DN1715_c0_g6~~TRINITY_DN1715_c0_g6_i4.p1  ORF type:complete len:220 (-),score=70.97 TRINITY_DN1715_c0_g6_i4:133-744(-)